MSAEVDVVVPSVGESVSEGAIGRWFVKDGEFIQKDEPLFELESDKASMEVTAAESGQVKILTDAGQTVQIGATVAKIDTGAKAQKNGKTEPKAQETKEPKAQKAEAQPEPVQAEKKSTKSKVDEDKIKQFPPSKRRAIRHGEMKLPAESSSGTNIFESGDEETRTPMTSLRKTIAKKLLHSQQSTATLTTFNEVDMSQTMAVRSKLKDKFQKEHGVKLGFMSFFTAAVVDALKAHPTVNSYLDGTDVVSTPHVHIAIAVSTERGLVVPVMRKVEKMSYAEIEIEIGKLAEKARDGKLSIPEMQGGTFTITNGGVFGSLLSTPILNPPQSGILGMHKIEQRPRAIEKDGKWSVEVRPMMYVALSYDHRLIDGATSVGFLVKVKEYLESVTESQVM